MDFEWARVRRATGRVGRVRRRASDRAARAAAKAGARRSRHEARAPAGAPAPWIAMVQSAKSPVVRWLRLWQSRRQRASSQRALRVARC